MYATINKSSVDDIIPQAGMISIAFVSNVAEKIVEWMENVARRPIRESDFVPQPMNAQGVQFAWRTSIHIFNTVNARRAILDDDVKCYW